MNLLFPTGHTLCQMCDGRGSNGDSCINPNCDSGYVEITDDMGKDIERAEVIRTFMENPNRMF